MLEKTCVRPCFNRLHGKVQGKILRSGMALIVIFHNRFTGDFSTAFLDGKTCIKDKENCW